MIDTLLGFFQGLLAEDSEAEPEHNIPLAAAALMLEVSRSDSTKTSIELDAIAGLLKQQFGLAEAEVSALVAAAEDQVEVAHDLFQFTHIVNQRLDRTRKKQLLYAMWRVAFADGRVDAIEDHIIRRVAGLLHLEHDDFIREKLRARDEPAG